jgi:RND family efflux transporter MFP subunit
MRHSTTISSVAPVAFVLCACFWQSVDADELNGLDCLVQPYATAELSSSVTGVIESINVDRSDTVHKGQILASLESDVEQVKYKMAQARAKYDGELESSKINLGFSDREYKRISELYREKVVSLSEKEKTEASLELAKFEYDRVRHENEVLDLELELARANLELRRIISPIDGIVVDRYMMPGEYVENKPVLKVAQLQPLRIEVIASVHDFGRIHTGMHARVVPEIGEYGELVAEVVLVDKMIDAASGTFGVRLLLDNRDLAVPGGLKCRLEFLNASEEAAYLQQQSTRSSIPEEPAASSVAPARQGSSDGAASESATTERYCATLSDWDDKRSLQKVLHQLDTVVSDFSISSYNDDTVLWQVLSEAFGTRQEAGAMYDEIRGKGVLDVALLPGERNIRVSFGMFASESSAQQRQLKISGLGYRTEIIRKVASHEKYRAEVFLTGGTDYPAIAASLDNADDLARISLRQCSGISSGKLAGS